MTTMDMSSEMQAMESRRTWGQILVLLAHAGRPFLGARVFVALKMANADATMERTMSEQAKLMPRRKIFANRTRTFIFRSLACSLSVSASRFSSWCSSRKVGLMIDIAPAGVRGGAPGDFKALLRGVFGVGGGRYLRSVSSISTDCCIKPKPVSAIWGCGL